MKGVQSSEVNKQKWRWKDGGNGRRKGKKRKGRKEERGGGEELWIFLCAMMNEPKYFETLSNCTTSTTERCWNIFCKNQINISKITKDYNVNSNNKQLWYAIVALHLYFLGTAFNVNKQHSCCCLWVKDGEGRRSKERGRRWEREGGRKMRGGRSWDRGGWC